MKKYIQPQTTVIKIQSQHLMTASDNSDPTQMGASDTEVSGGSALSRRSGSIWDADDEEY
mgnify:CR=1 FL=1